MSEDRETEELEPLRRRIDGLDRQLVELLNERARVVEEIGRVKRDSGSAIYAPDREHRVLSQLRTYNNGPLPQRCVDAIWRELMSGSFALERNLRVGYLGPVGSFSHLAARNKFGACADYRDMESIRHVFDHVSNGEIDLGLVPIENSSQGGIGETLDAFVECPVRVCAEVLIAIHHNLLANCPIEQVERVYSKPEALSQCRGWLARHLPRVERIGVASTSTAVERAAGESRAAAIGSALAAQTYDVGVLAPSIEDEVGNVTRFFVIAGRSAARTGDDKTAMMFTTAHRAGSLAAVLDVLRDSGLNLTHIDKRPTRMTNWEYFFFVDFEGHESDRKISDAIVAVRAQCLKLTILGSFPRAGEVL